MAQLQRPLTETSPPLSSEQTEQFVRDGFVKVTGLIPPDIVQATCTALLTQTEHDNDQSSETKLQKYLRLADLTAPCRTSGIEAVAQQLVGPHFLRGVTYSPFLETLGAEAKLFHGFIPVLRTPEPGPQEFVPPTDYHIDGIHRVSLLPQSSVLVVFAYLTDVAEYGGATVVRPGSHRQVFEYWSAQAAPDTGMLPELPYAAPVPVAGMAGDVIFMHYLTVHSGSINRANTVRVGLNTSVVPDPGHLYRVRTGPPASDWTPLDRTLSSVTID
jgi:hypothetical protein